MGKERPRIMMAGEMSTRERLGTLLAKKRMLRSSSPSTAVRMA
jgi:hypothetical protein